MDISSISKSYEMVDIEVTPEQLLLDPYNPRIALDMDEKTYGKRHISKGTETNIDMFTEKIIVDTDKLK